MIQRVPQEVSKFCVKLCFLFSMINQFVLISTFTDSEFFYDSYFFTVLTFSRFLLFLSILTDFFSNLLRTESSGENTSEITTGSTVTEFENSDPKTTVYAEIMDNVNNDYAEDDY